MCALAVLSCTNPVPEGMPRPTATGGAITLAVEPEAELGAVPRVIRLHASYASRAAPPELALFAGELSDYHARRVRDADLPGTLLERQVSTVQWEVEPGHAVLAPQQPLVAGGAYTLVALGSGAVQTVFVRDAEPAPYFARSWPPLDAEQPFGGLAVYCGPEGDVPLAHDVELAPGPLLAALTKGVGPESVAGERCFQLLAEPLAGFAFLLPPPSIMDVAIDPAPLVGGPEPAVTPVACTALEQELGPACLEVVDDRLFVRTAEPALLAVKAPGLESLHTLASEGRFVVRGLTPSSAVPVHFTLLTPSGTALMETRQLLTLSPQTRVVITEVLANPVGSEPEQEWVEIVNDGSARVELSDFTFADGGEELALPQSVLEPGQFALIVGKDFQAAALGDVPVPESCPLLRLPKLGKNGLANGGEGVRLRSAAAGTLSQFPPLPSPKPGVSLARRDVAARDDDAASFALHGDPGASPCAANF